MSKKDIKSVFDRITNEPQDFKGAVMAEVKPLLSKSKGAWDDDDIDDIDLVIEPDKKPELKDYIIDLYNSMEENRAEISESLSSIPGAETVIYGAIKKIKEFAEKGAVNQSILETVNLLISFLMRSGIIKILPKVMNMNATFCSLKPLLIAVREILNDLFAKDVTDKIKKMYADQVLTDMSNIKNLSTKLASTVKDTVASTASNLVSKVSSYLNWTTKEEPNPTKEEVKPQPVEDESVKKLFNLLESVANNIKTLPEIAVLIIKEISNKWDYTSQARFLGMILSALDILIDNTNDETCTKYENIDKQIESFRKQIEKLEKEKKTIKGGKRTKKNKKQKNKKSKNRNQKSAKK